MKATNINAIAKDIRVNRQKFESIVNDFRAYWGKVYRTEVTESLGAVVDALKNDPKNQTLKNERYAIEQVCAKIKSLTLTDEIKELVKNLHDNYGLTFACLNADYIREGLRGTDYVNDADDICELRKANKEATEKTWNPVEKWTEAKVGRYFRYVVLRKMDSAK